MKHASKSSLLVLSLALSLCSCTAIQWRDGEGDTRYFGLVLAGSESLDSGYRHAWTSFGIVLSLVPGARRVTFGIDRRIEEGAALRALDAPAGRDEVVSVLTHEADPELDPVAVTRPVACFVVQRSLGLSLGQSRPMRGLSLGATSGSMPTNEALKWNRVFLRRTCSGGRATELYLWELQ